jgi:hypothetical protein
VKLVRLAFLVGCLALVVGALRYERHEVRSLDAKGKPSETDPAAAPQVMNGLALTETATVDGLLRADGILYDVYSLRPVSSEGDVVLDVKKECPT